jgi:hypothetical protein
MNATNKTRQTLDDVRVNTKVKLAALWTTIMFLFAYADIQHFVLQPGSVSEILNGSIGGMQTTPTFLFAAAALMIVPTLMIYLSVALKPSLNRWVNIIFGSIYTLITIATWLVPGETWAYYYFYNLFEVILTALVVWHAWNWPRS